MKLVFPNLLYKERAEQFISEFKEYNSDINGSGALDSYLENVSEGLANLINRYDIEMLGIGGSLSEYGEKFLPKLKTKVANKIYNKYTYDLNMKITTLKNDAGIIGASLLRNYM